MVAVRVSWGTRLATSALLSLGLLIAGPRASVSTAHASISLELTLSHLSRTASRIVIGTPIEAVSVWEPTESGRNRIVTYQRVRVNRHIAGSGASEVWVRRLGGQIDNVGQKVEGEAILTLHQPHLMFLTDRRDGTDAVAGMAQGIYLITRAPDGIERLSLPSQRGIILPLRHGRGAATQLVGLTVEHATALVLRSRANHD